MAVGSPLLIPVHQFFDDDGNPLAGGKLESFLAGTSTPSPLYTEQDLATPHANPAILDASGRITAFMDALAYDLVLYDADDNVIWTAENVQAVRVVSGDVGIAFEFGGEAAVSITATSYPTGTGVDTLHAGTSIMRTNTADLPAGTYRLECMMLSNGGVTVSAALVNLSDGAPNVAITGGEVTSTNTTGEYKQSSNLTLPAGGSNKDLGIKVKVSSGTGFAWGFKLRKVA